MSGWPHYSVVTAVTHCDTSALKFEIAPHVFQLNIVAASGHLKYSDTTQFEEMAHCVKFNNKL